MCMPLLLPIKAACLQEPSAKNKPEGRVILLPLDGRNGFAFALWSLPKNQSNDVMTALLTDHLVRLSENFGSSTNPQYRFEQFLSALNEQLAVKVKDDALQISIQDVNALVGVACEESIFLSGTGDLSALFLYRKPDQTYQVFNLFRGIQTEQSLPTWEKVFAIVLDGDLHPGDVLCLSNKDLARAISADELNSFLSALPPTGSVERIRQHFSHQSGMASLVLQVQIPPSLLTTEQAKTLASVSVEHFEQTREETTRILEDQRPNVIGFFQSLRARMRPERQSNAPRKPLRLFLAQIGSAFASFFLSFQKSPKSGSRIRQWILKSVDRFNDFPKRSRYLLLASITAVFFLSVGILFLGNSQSAAREKKAFDDGLTQISSLRDQSMAASIYNDRQKARALLADASALLSSLRAKSTEQKTEVIHWQEDLAASLNQFNRVVNVPEPPIVGDMAIIGTKAKGSRLARTAGFILVFGSDRRVYQWDSAQKTFSVRETAIGDVGVASAVANSEKSILFLDSRPGISRFDPVNNLLQVTNLNPASDAWKDIAFYGGKLYVLAVKDQDGRLLRYSETGNDFSSENSWIKSKTASLADAVSVTIDGSVFILKKDGSVVRFMKGGEVGWRQETAEPAIKDATRVWTSVDSPFLYILEPSAKRLLVYHKETGVFLNQYRSDAFVNLADFLVDEPTKTLYFLAGSKLFAIQATHLP